MAERLNLGDLQGVLDKAVAQVMSNRAIGHGPIVVGFVAPDTLGAADAQKIADEVSKSVPNSRPTVVGVGDAAAEGAARAATLSRIPIIIGLLFD